MKISARERLLTHLTNIEMALQDKAEELNNAADQILELHNELADGGSFRTNDVLREAAEIWSSVMETPYDPEY